MFDPVVSYLAESLTRDWSLPLIIGGIVLIVCLLYIPFYFTHVYFHKRGKHDKCAITGAVFLFGSLGIGTAYIGFIAFPVIMQYQDCSRTEPATLETEAGTYETTLTYCRFREYKGAEWSEWEPAMTRDNNWKKVEE